MQVWAPLGSPHRGQELGEGLGRWPPGGGGILGPGGRGLSCSQPLMASADQESGPGLAGCVCLHVGRSQAGAVGGSAPKLTHVGTREFLPKAGRVSGLDAHGAVPCRPLRSVAGAIQASGAEEGGNTGKSKREGADSSL